MEWITEVLLTLDIHVVDLMNTKVIIVDSAVSNKESVESMSNNESGLARFIYLLLLLVTKHPAAGE